MLFILFFSTVLHAMLLLRGFAGYTNRKLVLKHIGALPMHVVMAGISDGQSTYCAQMCSDHLTNTNVYEYHTQIHTCTHISPTAALSNDISIQLAVSKLMLTSNRHSVHLHHHNLTGCFINICNIQYLHTNSFRTILVLIQIIQ